MLRVGLTGGVGCGKTMVAENFKRLGVPVIDADELTRELVTPPSDSLDAIVARFGPGVLRSGGRLDRRKLREIVFEDSRARRDLEAILHPRVRGLIEERGSELDAPYCLIAVPLLVESGMLDLAQRVLVVDCEPEQQIERVTSRDGIPPAQVRAIMNSQVSREARLEAASEVIRNSADPESLEKAIRRLHRYFLWLADKNG